MKSSRIVIFAAVALCAAQLFAAHTEVTKAPRLPFMRGMGFFGFYSYVNDQYAKKASVMATLNAKGFDHIRLPVDFRLYSTYDDSTGVATLLDRTYVRPSESWAQSFYAGFSDFDTVITNAINAGLYVTLDFHGWFDIDVTNKTHRAQFKAIWKAVAERYQGYPNKLIFELTNEPQAPVGHSTSLNSLQKEAVAIIRQTNPTRLILYAVPDSNQPWALTQASNPPKFHWVSTPEGDNNIALVIHEYAPGWFTHQGESWTSNPNMTKTGLDQDWCTTNSNGVVSHTTARTTVNWDLDQCKIWMDNKDTPLVMNEFNVSHRIAEKADITEYLSIVTRWCESHKVPWSPWIYYSDGGGMDCFESGSGSLTDYTEAGLFPDLKTTDKFSTSDYPHKIDITFSGYAGSSPLANFPVLVKLSERLTGFRYSDFTRADGFDLCFTDASGNLIPHEIDTWNPNGVSTVWVKVPSLSSSVKIVARYGCAKPIVPKVESVWDSDYVAVWHMGEPKLPLADSSNATRDLTASDGDGLGYGVCGVAGGAVDFGASGGSRGLFADDHFGFDGHTKLTVEAWTFQKDHVANAGILSKCKAAGEQVSYYLYDNGSSTAFQVSSNGTATVSSGVNLNPVARRWNHQAYTIDTTASANNASGYLDGTRVGTATASMKGPVFAGAGELCIGNLNSGSAANFPGRIDEVRISKCVRSADWIKASYDTVANASFATYAVDGVVSDATPEEQGENLVPDDLIEYGQLDKDSFAKKMTVTFSGYSDASLADFPVLVKLSSAIDGFSYGDFQKPNGGDLRFADASGTLLPHEIDTWNSNGVSTVWVKVPLLAANGTITACYGCDEPPRVSAKDVWDGDYLGVWHLGAASGETVQPDSTRNEKNFIVNANNSDGVASGADGVVGRSASTGCRDDGKGCFSHSDGNQFFAGRSAFTVETWTWQDDHEPAQNPTLRYVLAHNGGNEDSYDWRVYENTKGKLVMQFYSLGSLDGNTAKIFADDTATRPAKAAWNHTAFAWDGSNGQLGLYLGGNPLAIASSVLTNDWTGAMAGEKSGFNLGNHRYDNTKSFKGRIDEVRISKVARSAAWIKATHDTIANDDFATYAMKGDQPPEPQVVFAKEIAVSFSGYSGTALANFPVLVRLSIAIPGFSYSDFALANGGDLRFFDAAGNLLPHEIDTWNESGVSTVWVKVPTLDASTAITAKYGCTGTPPAVDTKDVWDDDYLGVWHLGAASGVSTQGDSTGRGHDFAINTNNSDGVASGADGVVGRAAATGVRTDGKGCFFQSDSVDKIFSGHQAFTAEAWTWQDDHDPAQIATNRYVLAHSGQNETSYDWRLYETPEGKMAFQMFGVGGGMAIVSDDSAPRPGRNAWNYTSVAWDGSAGQAAVYLGGSPLALSASAQSANWHGTMQNAKTGFNLGNHRYDNGNSFRGGIDEVRLSKVARSATWIKATHDTIANFDFATYTTSEGTLSGYSAWMNTKEISGSPDETAAKNIANGVRYAFDIDPLKGPAEMGDPIIKVVRDASGNPVVEARELAEGRDDVTFGVLATENLTDWSNATLVPMKKFETDGFWKPTASDGNAGYVYPSKMFFKYTVEVK